MWFPYSGGRFVAPDPHAPALEVRGLFVCYPGSSRFALRGIDLRVERGSRLALVGPNGAGKSTLLKAIAGLIPVAGGTIRVHGHAVGACHHRVAYLPQRGDIDWTFPVSVERFTLAGRYVHLGWLRRPGPRDRQITTHALTRLGLAELAARQIGQLSGGQQQRALLARALAQEADVLLLDEPLNAVDAASREAIYAILAELAAEGKTLLVATHDHSRLATAFDAVVQLQDGLAVPAEPLAAADPGPTAWTP